MVHNTTEIDRSVGAQRKLVNLTQKRLERFVTLMPKFLVNHDPDTVHDLRVWSRRLQQTLRTIIDEKTPASRKAIRMLRRVRRALGACRNLDVNFDLIQQRARQARAAVSRDAWEALGAHLKNSRDPLVAAARKEVAKQDFVGFIERARKLIEEADRDVDPTVKLKAALAASMKEWDKAFRLALETRSVENLHVLRIATKRLRYRAELLADSGRAAIASMVKDFKEIQTALGDWHDQSVLLQYAGEFLGRPESPVEHPDQAGALRAELKKEEQRNDEAVVTLLRRAGRLRKRWSNGNLYEKKRKAAS